MKYLFLSVILLLSLNLSAQDCTETSVMQKPGIWKEKFGRVLIKPNPGYFNNKLFRSSPQFFLVNVTGNEKDPVSANVMTDLMKDFDFSALKNMLGK